MRPTITAIARRTGKHPSTVSRVLSGDQRYSISDACRQQILSVARQLNYVPRHSGRSLATGRSYTVAAVLGTMERDLASPSQAATLMELSRVLLRHGYHLSLFPPTPGQSHHQHVCRALRQGRFDGLYVGSRMIRRQTLEELADHQVPVVTSEPAWSARRSPLLSTVVRDYTMGLRQMVQSLLRRGHRRALFVVSRYLLARSPSNQRVKLCREIAAAEGLQIAETDMLGYQHEVGRILAERGEARIAARAEMERVSQYSAIIGYSDMIAMGVADALRDAGLEPGRDVALVGGGNVETSPSHPSPQPFLATVEHHNRLRGRRIAEALLHRMQDPHRPTAQYLVPTRFIERPSIECQAQAGRLAASDAAIQDSSVSG